MRQCPIQCRGCSWVLAPPERVLNNDGFSCASVGVARSPRRAGYPGAAREKPFLSCGLGVRPGAEGSRSGMTTGGSCGGGAVAECWRRGGVGSVGLGRWRRLGGCVWWLCVGDGGWRPSAVRARGKLSRVRCQKKKKAFIWRHQSPPPSTYIEALVWGARDGEASREQGGQEAQQREEHPPEPAREHEEDDPPQERADAEPPQPPEGTGEHPPPPPPPARESRHEAPPREKTATANTAEPPQTNGTPQTGEKGSNHDDTLQSQRQPQHTNRSPPRGNEWRPPRGPRQRKAAASSPRPGSLALAGCGGIMRSPAAGGLSRAERPPTTKPAPGMAGRRLRRTASGGHRRAGPHAPPHRMGSYLS